MEVSSEYILTRAAGIKANLIPNSDLLLLAKLPNFEEFLEQMRNTPYRNFLSQEYTARNPLPSFTKSIHELAEKRWSLLADKAEQDLSRLINKIKEFTDILNLFLLADAIDTGKKKWVSPRPGGTLTQNIWKELLLCNNNWELDGKLTILVPELRTTLGPVFRQHLDASQRDIVQMNCLNELYKSIPKTDDKVSVLDYYFLDQINKLVLRIALRTSRYTEDQLSKILQSIEPWKDYQVYIGRKFEISNILEWSKICEEEIANLSHNISSLGDTQKENTYHEDDLSRITLHQMKKLSKFSENKYDHFFKILYQIFIETQNLIWIGFGLFCHLPNLVITRRLLLDI